MTPTDAQSPAKLDFAPAGLFADPLTDRLAGFVLGVGLTIEATALDGPTVLPGVTTRFDRLLVDEARLSYPGDLLHEAGHLAVLEPRTRTARESVGDDPAEEMAALAWSYAAALAAGVDPAVVFHADGYRGAAESLLEAFAHGGLVGTPLLQWYGMTLLPSRGDDAGLAVFPQMLRWLR